MRLLVCFVSTSQETSPLFRSYFSIPTDISLSLNKATLSLVASLALGFECFTIGNTFMMSDSVKCLFSE